MESIILKLERLSPGTVIPKSEANGELSIKGWGIRGGFPALVYFRASNTHPARLRENAINTLEWKQAYRQLLDTGEFTRKWYAHHMPRCSGECPSNFTAIGGLFSLLGLAKYESKGVYRSIVPKSA